MSYGSYGVCAPSQTYQYQVPFIPDRKLKLGHLQCWLRHESQATDFTSGHCDDIAVWHAGGDGRSGSFASKALRHLCFNHLRLTSYELRKLFPEVVSSLVFWSRLQIMMFFDTNIYIYIYLMINPPMHWKAEHTTHAKLANIYIVEFVWCNHPLVVIEWPSLLVWHSHVTSQVAANTHGSKEAALRIIRWSLVLQGKVRHCQGWFVRSGRSTRKQEI